MESRYNIYFEGQVLEGHQHNVVRDKLAKLFNADQQTLEKLFGGTTQLIKRDCDKATALKYKQAMERAGAKPVIRSADSPAPVQAAASEDKPSGTMTAAERIASLARAPDQGRYVPAEPAPTEEARPAGEDADEFDLAPAGSDVLLPGERQAPATREVDTSGLELDKTAQRLSAVSPPPPPAPDTSHLSEGPVGESLPNLPLESIPLDPDISAIDLAPEGTDFSDCAGPDPEVPNLDLSGMDLAPAGSDVLEQQYRKKVASEAPPVDHLSLED